MRRLRTWPGTIGRSLLIGSIVGALCISGLCFVFFGISSVFDRNIGIYDRLYGGALIVSISFIYGFLVWLVGIIFLGLGPWWLLHRLGFRTRLAAAGLGFVMPALLCALFTNGRAVIVGPALGTVGIVVAEAIWYSAYKYGAGGRQIEHMAPTRTSPDYTP